LQGGPRKELLFCNVVLGRRAAVVRRRFWPGEGGGVFYGPLGVDLGLGWLRKDDRQGCCAAPDGDRCWSGCFGEMGCSGRLVNGQRAMVGAGEQVLGCWDHGERPGTRFSCGGCRRRRRAREKRPWPLYIANEQTRGVNSTGRRP
jgi:hypothetical protein